MATLIPGVNLPPTPLLPPIFEYLRQYIDQDNWRIDINNPRDNELTDQDLDTYTIRTITHFFNADFTGGRLWTHFHQYFEEWDEEDFERLSKDVKGALRDYLRYSGVDTPRTRIRVATKLADVNKEEDPHRWTREEIARFTELDGPFNPKWNPFPALSPFLQRVDVQVAGPSSLQPGNRAGEQSGPGI